MDDNTAAGMPLGFFGFTPGMYADLLRQERELLLDSMLVSKKPHGWKLLTVYFADGTSTAQEIPPDLSYELDFGEARQVARVKLTVRPSEAAELRAAGQDESRRSRREDC